MGKLSNILKVGGLATGMFLSSLMSSKAQSQTLEERVIDPIMKLVSPADTTDDGLEGMYITLTDNFSGDVYSTTTDLEGRVIDPIRLVLNSYSK